MPTFANLSPLRQSISNPNMKEAADLVLTFGATSTNSANGGDGDTSPQIGDAGLQIGKIYIIYACIEDG